jgi:hypothetical protein
MDEHETLWVELGEEDFYFEGEMPRVDSQTSYDVIATNGLVSKEHDIVRGQRGLSVPRARNEVRAAETRVSGISGRLMRGLMGLKLSAQ